MKSKDAFLARASEKEEVQLLPHIEFQVWSSRLICLLTAALPLSLFPTYYGCVWDLRKNELILLFILFLLLKWVSLLLQKSAFILFFHSYFQQNVFNFNKISGFQTDPHLLSIYQHASMKTGNPKTMNLVVNLIYLYLGRNLVQRKIWKFRHENVYQRFQKKKKNVSQHLSPYITYSRNGCCELKNGSF